jgi:hypothetical protein
MWNAHRARRALAAFAIAALCVVAHADKITLKDGKTLEGRIVFEDATKLVLRVGTKDREIPIDTVADVQSVVRDLRDLLERWGKLAPDDSGGRLDLARVARSKNLPGEADVLAWSVLAKDPGHAGAHQFLGHVSKGGKWLVKEGVRSVPYETLVEERKDFKDAWRLSTTHFALRTNVALDLACDTAYELELYYQVFFDWFKPELDLFEVTEVIQEHVHADRASYPGGSGPSGFYDEDANTAFVDMSTGFAIESVVHETTHALLHNTAVRTKTARGNIPPWINEGLADYMKFCRSGRLAHPVYTKGAASKLYFRMHASARPPYDLSRVLAFSTEDFIFSSQVGLSCAQSHTLLHYCLHGADEKYRAKFFEFLRRCYAGHSSATDFKSALGIKEAEFEAEWHAYARTFK